MVCQRITAEYIFPYLTLPYLYGHRDRKATWPGDPVLTELMIVDIQDSYGFGVSNIMFVQCLSSRFLKLLSVSADTTDEGNEFQSLTILVLNAFLRVSVLARGLYSFHPLPRVNSDSFLLKKSSGIRPSLGCYAVEQFVYCYHVSAATAAVQ